MGRSYIEDISSADIEAAIDSGRFAATTDYKTLSHASVISVCVPTPLSKSKDPDMGYVASAIESIARVLGPGQTVVLESTVYPGATEEFVRPLLEKNGLKAGTDFFLAFSPERIDPGNNKFAISDIPKVVGGINEESCLRAAAHYHRVFKTIVQVTSTREAEMAKLLENTFRAVNIGLVNELAIAAHTMHIDIWDVIDAASTKPFGFMPFYPGPGWGGHCIPVDPFYLTWRARAANAEIEFIDHAGRVNRNMPRYTIMRLMEILNSDAKSLNGAEVLVLGAAYKRNVKDVRESPSIELMDLLEEHGAKVRYHDPHVPSFIVDGKTRMSVDLTPDVISEQDCVLIATDHHDVNYELIGEHAKRVLDCRNAMRELRSKYPQIQRL
jgi:UDP-N-acetyl-D-glucosamine dehydrogenase